MATKYMMVNLRASLVRILESEWPTTVDEFDAKDQPLHDFLKRSWKYEARHLRDKWPAHWIPEPGAAIWLAEEFGITSILPAAYYDLSRCNPRYDWVEFSYEDLTAQSRKCARWGCLPRESLRKLHRLQDILLDVANDLWEDLKINLASECHCACFLSRQTDCEKIWARMVKEASDTELRPNERDVLLELRNLRTRVVHSAICPKSKDLFVSAINESREEIWVRIQMVCSDPEDPEYS